MHILPQICVILPARRKQCAGNSHHRVSVCLSVCPKRRITPTTPRDSPGNLVFWRQNSSVGDPLPSEICVQNDPPPFHTAQFRLIFAHSASIVRANEKSSISANRKSITRFPTSHRWTVYVTPNCPKSPKGWHKTRFCYFFLVNFKFCRKKSAAKFLRVKTSSSKL